MFKWCYSSAMTDKMQPWQEKIFIDIESGGFKPSEMAVMMAGRNTGKSIAASYAVFKKLFDEAMKPRPLTDLILDEAKVHGARYYTVQPEGGVWAEMEAWCKESFGEPGDMWESNDWCWPESARWLQNNRKFWFRNIKDRDWFIIRWQA